MKLRVLLAMLLLVLCGGAVMLASDVAIEPPTADEIKPEAAVGAQVEGTRETPALTGNLCPSTPCGSLVNATYLGGCYNAPHECVGFKYRDSGGQLCFVSALS